MQRQLGDGADGASREMGPSGGGRVVGRTAMGVGGCASATQDGRESREKWASAPAFTPPWYSGLAAGSFCSRGRIILHDCHPGSGPVALLPLLPNAATSDTRFLTQNDHSCL